MQGKAVFSPNVIEKLLSPDVAPLATDKFNLFGPDAILMPTFESALEFAFDDLRFGELAPSRIPFSPETVRNAIPEELRHLNLSVGVPTFRDAMKEAVGNHRAGTESSTLEELF